MSTTPTLGLTLMTAAQAQKETVFNEAIVAFDILFRGVVISSSLSAPPGSPSTGDTYIVAASATGAWSGQDHNIAWYFNGWQFITAKDQMRMYDEASSEWRVYHVSTTSWDAEPTSTVSVLNDLTNVQGSPTNGQVLTYVSADGKWEPQTPAFTGSFEQLSDVNITTGSGINGYAAIWNQTAGKWQASPVLTAKPNALSLPDVTVPSGVANNWVAVYNSTGPGLTFVSSTSIITTSSLDQVGDVSYPGGGAPDIPSGAYLQWNGAAWVPSTSAVAISVESLSDGPGALTGKALQYVRVDSAETALEYHTLAVADVSGAAPLASPALTGNPTAPTQTSGDNSTKLANTAFVQNAVSGVVSGLTYQGTWNASTNSPTLTSSTGTAGQFYKVSVAGTTILDGVSSWTVGDMVLFDGTTWDRLASTDPAVFSVAGKTGAVTLALTDLTDVNVTEGSGIDGYALCWKNGDSKWEAKAFPAGALASLSDVSITTGAGVDGYSVTWNNTAGKFELTNVSGGGGGGTGSSTLAGDSDVSITSPSDGQSLVYVAASSKWENQTLSGAGALLPPQYEHGPFAPPLASWFTTTDSYSGITVTLTDNSNQGLSIKATGASANNQIATILRDASAWGSSWSVTARIVNSNLFGQYPFIGLGILDTSGKITFIGAFSAGGASLACQRYNSNSSYAGGDVISQATAGRYDWFRIRLSGGNLYYGASNDGINWMEVETTETAFLGTISKVGIMTSPYGGVGAAQEQTLALCTYYDDPQYPASGHTAATSAVLGDISDVSLTSLTDGQALVYDGGLSKWVNKTTNLGSVVSTPPTIVNHGLFNTNTTTITLGWTPTVGNIVVCLATHWHNVVTPGTGWHTIFAVDGSTNSGVAILYKMWSSGDTTLQTPFTNGGGDDSCVLALFEIAGGYADFTNYTAFKEVSGVATFGLSMSNVQPNSLVVGAFFAEGTSVTLSSLGATALDTSLSQVTSQHSPMSGVSFSESFTAYGVMSVNATWSATVDGYGLALMIPNGPTVLSSVADVKLATPQNGQALVYNSTDQAWENGTPVLSEGFQKLTFTSTASIFGASGVHASDQTFSLAVGQMLQVEGFVYKSSANAGLIGISDDGSTGYAAANDSSGSASVSYYSGASHAISSASAANWTGVHELKLSACAIGSSDNAVRGTVDGANLAVAIDTNVNLVGTVTVYLLTDDLTKCAFKARVVNAAMYG